MSANLPDDFRGRMEKTSILAGNATRLAEKTGISRRSIGDYLAGRAEPSRPRLVAMAQAAGVRVEWLATGAGPMRNAQLIPLVGLHDGAVPGWWRMESLPLHVRVDDQDDMTESFAFLVKGEAMEPEGLLQGNLVRCRRRDVAALGQAVLVMLHDGAVALRRYDGRDPEGGVILGFWRGAEPVCEVRSDVVALIPVIRLASGETIPGFSNHSDICLSPALVEACIGHILEWLRQNQMSLPDALVGRLVRNVCAALQERTVPPSSEALRVNVFAVLDDSLKVLR